ncbi:LLM class F420-dependent oxidoreductase [Amycolatopsis sp. GM8]|uniref:LLM class F420-dependent oxidoreductase n=1 Tax=Amycolatopsis sp. GM8 TaxID=2896530 RepID=UPI001F3194CA|nr:LLM class F420-dependent oxidoreductase [Amycolatopsis sp. GM8]
MKIGVQFFVTGYTVDAVTLAKALEDGGFESFWAPEHTVLPANPQTPYPMTGGAIPSVYGQMADPFVLLSFMAATTKSLKVGTGVCLVPEHHPLVLAKAVSTLDNFSGGRMLFGIGTGWLPEVTGLLNPHAATPWRYTRETIEAMRALWTDGSASYKGELLEFPEMICDPRPVQSPHPPVIMGAMASERSYRRIAAWGDGWLAMGVSPEQLADARRAIGEECKRIGRDPGEIEISVGVRDASPAIQRAYQDAGADRLIVLLYNHPGEPVPMERWPEVGMAGLAGDPPSAADTLRAVERVHEMAGL